ncbi:Sister chromatid cohesion protein pds5 [Grifola frondosa]|uniref:Sister chromatid cohesion protein pds5 n=1 Tax=Grifola frondosa TaxID=5627 RepID=A0A1C7MKW7_GRIFR|nr:Sister chromatid cohesion protein pds5 [Grifola frondosa]
MVAQTRTAGQPSPRKLKFHDKLVGKGLSTDALQKKLKALHTELADMDQELVDVHSLSAVRKELINTSILLHKDRGVKAYAACCLADLLRLYAPDAPYTHTELRDIFQFFFRQLTAGLKGPDSPYYNEYFHLLESLSTVKSVVLVCDLPNAEELMVEVFRDFFLVVRRDLAKKIELFMADILIALIDECQSLPYDVLETIMTQFMDKNARMDQPAYRLAVQVCNATSDKLQRHVCQYFTDIIVDRAREEEFDEVRNAHDLIKQLNRSCPSLLHNVVPQLEEELRVEQVQLRVMATQVLGEMFADKGGTDLAKKYPTTWNFWLLRKNDKNVTVRLTFVETLKGLLANLTDAREEVEATLQLKLFDPDEKVRAAVCKLYAQLDYETALHHVSEAQLRSVVGRGLDKKHLVRMEAMNAAGRLYSLAYPEIENNDTAAVAQFSWIPEEILHMASTTKEVKAVAEQILAEYILPLPSPSASTSKGSDIDEVAWTDRLLLTMRFLDEPAINALLSFSGLKGVEASSDENEDAVADRLNNVTKMIAAHFSDPQKATDDLKTFANANEGRLYKLLKTCMDPQTDLKGLVKATNEFLRRVEQSSPSILPTMTTFVRRASLRMVNQSSIPTLVKRIQKGDSASDGLGNSLAQASAHNAQIWMSYVSKHCPAIHKSHIGEFSKAIADDKNTQLVEVCLQALAAVAMWDNRLTPSDKRTTERVMRFVMDSNYRHAKFAARILACSKNAEDLCGEVVDSIAEELPEADPDHLVAHISVLAQLALKAPDAFEQKSDVIMAFLLKQVLMKPQSDLDQMDTDEEWVEGSAMTPELRAKLLSLKVCRNRCIAHSSAETAVDIARPVLKMFAALIRFNGSFTSEAVDDPKTKARLRLQAAISLLHLSTIEAYAGEIGKDFVGLAIMIQDPCYQVRMTFMEKLVLLLSTRKLPVQFNVIPFLSVHDPEADAQAYVSFAVRAMPKAVKLTRFEYTFIRLLHLLAHHPDFAVTEESLPDIAKYIEFYLDLVASAENVALLYHLAMKAKTVRDAESHVYSENLYVAAELAQHLIKARAKSHSWSLESFPGKVRLPADILRPLPNAEAANEILKTIYLPENTLSWLAEHAKQSKAAQEPKPDKPRAERKTAGKRKAAAKTNGSTKRPRITKRRKADESDEEESLPSESDEDIDEPTSAGEPDESESSEEEAQKPEREEKLGRGARTRAKARIKQQAKKSAKRKPKVSSSDD